jgi:hypothetical protein
MERAQPVSLDQGQRSRNDSRVPQARPHRFGLAAIPVTEDFRTRGACRGCPRAEPVLNGADALPIADDEFAAVSILRRMLPAKSTSLCGDRARRFAWPARGTERFLGRDVQHSPGKRNAGRSRPGVGTRLGQTPYSCLVPPRYFSLLGKQLRSGTPDQEPSRRRTSQTQNAFGKYGRPCRLRQGKTHPDVAVEGTSLIPEGPDNGSPAPAPSRSNAAMPLWPPGNRRQPCCSIYENNRSNDTLHRSSY